MAELCWHSATYTISLRPSDLFQVCKLRLRVLLGQLKAAKYLLLGASQHYTNASVQIPDARHPWKSRVPVNHPVPHMRRVCDFDVLVAPCGSARHCVNRPLDHAHLDGARSAHGVCVRDDPYAKLVSQGGIFQANHTQDVRRNHHSYFERMRLPKKRRAEGLAMS
jgi:hypothetical protein